MREQAIFNLEIKKKSGLSINPDIHHSKVPSSVDLYLSRWKMSSYAQSIFIYSFDPAASIYFGLFGMMSADFIM